MVITSRFPLIRILSFVVLGFFLSSCSLDLKLFSPALSSDQSSVSPPPPSGGPSGDFSKLEANTWELSCAPAGGYDRAAVISFDTTMGVYKAHERYWFGTSNGTCGGGAAADYDLEAAVWSRFYHLTSVSGASDPSAGNGDFYFFNGLFSDIPLTGTMYITNDGQNLVFSQMNSWISETDILSNGTFLTFAANPLGTVQTSFTASVAPAPTPSTTIYPITSFTGNLAAVTGTYTGDCFTAPKGQTIISLSNGVIHMRNVAYNAGTTSCIGAVTDAISAGTAFTWSNYGHHPVSAYSFGYYGALEATTAGKGYYFWLSSDASMICYNLTDADGEFSAGTPPAGQTIYDDFAITPVPHAGGSDIRCLFRTSTTP